MCCRSGKSRVLVCAALGLERQAGLRDHQQQALDFLDIDAQPETDRRRSLFVFSSKPLLEQFQKAELEKYAEHVELFLVYESV